jgi:tetratricopeptide (TPR) repeat protein
VTEVESPPPDEVPEPDVPEPDEVPEEYRDPFARRIAICTVVTTLLAALVGFMLAVSSGHASDAASTAQRFSVQAAGETERSQQQAQADFETFVLAEEHRTRAANTDQRMLFENDARDERRLKVRKALWDDLAQETEELTPLRTDSEFGPEADPLFPTRFFTVATQESNRLLALQDAAKVTSDAWGGQAAGYTAVLTIFAVGLYLFGLALTLGRDTRRLFAGVALVLVLVGFGWATWVYLDPPQKISDKAAASFAEGEVAFLTAATQDDYREAVERYRETVALRPDFARAHLRLASAAYQAGSPQRSGYQTLSSPEAIDTAIEELETARDLGMETVELYGSLGAYYFQRAVLRDEPDDFEKSVELTEAALGLDPGRDWLKMNLGLMRFALGDEKAARELLKEAAASEDNDLIIGAMGDLDLLADQGPDEVAAAAPDMKEYLAGIAPLPVEGVRDPGEFELTDVTPHIFPSSVQVKFGVEGDFDNGQDLLTVYWYHRDEGGLGWSPVPEVSWFYYPTTDPGVDGGYYIEAPYLTATSPRRCMPAGEYRVEVYADDQLVGTAETETSFGQLEAAAFADLNTAFCHPDGWERVAEPSLSRPGLVRGYRSPDGSQGVFMVRMQTAGGPIAALSPQKRTKTIADFVAEEMEFGLGDVTFDSKAGTYFMGLEGGRMHYYSYPGGNVLVGAGVDTDGSVLVGLTYGPVDAFDEEGKDALSVFDSAVLFTQLTQD